MIHSPPLHYAHLAYILHSIKQSHNICPSPLSSAVSTTIGETRQHVGGQENLISLTSLANNARRANGLSCSGQLLLLQGATAK